jgi:hypothetical protein
LIVRKVEDLELLVSEITKVLDAILDIIWLFELGRAKIKGRREDKEMLNGIWRMSSPGKWVE